jgi:hypothetical protein
LGGEKAYKPIGVRFSLKWGGGWGGKNRLYTLRSAILTKRESPKGERLYTVCITLRMIRNRRHGAIITLTVKLNLVQK